MLQNRKSIYLDLIPGEGYEEKLKNAAEAGFAAVEAPGIEDETERRELKALYAKYKLVCPSVMTSGAWNYPATSPDPEIRAKSAECYKTAIRTAVELGCDTILTVPGAVTEEIDYMMAWDNAHKTLESVIPFAAENKIYMAVENVWNKFLLSPREMAQFIDSFNSEWVGAYFDVGNILLYGYPQHWIKQLGSRIKKVHIKGSGHADWVTFKWTSLLEGDINWKIVMAELKAIGFEGYLTAELSPDDRGLKGIADDMDYILSL